MLSFLLFQDHSFMDDVSKKIFGLPGLLTIDEILFLKNERTKMFLLIFKIFLNERKPFSQM